MNNQNCLGAVLLTSIFLNGCSSVPSKPVDLGLDSDQGRVLVILEDKRPIAARRSIETSDHDQYAYQYGDEHFHPAPIVALDNALARALPNNPSAERIRIEKFEIADTQPINRGGGAGVAGISYPAAVLIESIGVPFGGNYMTCKIHGTLGQQIVSADIIRYDDGSIDERLRLLVDECVQSFVRHAADYRKSQKKTARGE